MLCQVYGALHGGVERRHVTNRMIRRQDQQQALGIGLDDAKRGGGDRRRRVLRLGLEEVKRRRYTDFTQLLGGQKTLLEVRDDRRGRCVA